DRFVFRRRVDLHFADRAAVGAGRLRPADLPGGRRAIDLRYRRRADYRFSGAGAERPRPPVANWQAEIEGVALSILVAVILSQFQSLIAKVRHDKRSKNVIDPAKETSRVVAPLNQQALYLENKM